MSDIQNTIDSITASGSNETPAEHHFDVTGMTCAHCVASVTEEVSELPGVTNVTVELHPGEVSRVVVATGTPVSSDAISRAIAEAGYAAIVSS
ncbi:heavy-metal-associated domain-containing protein [Subtercola frigoramans]|uniref:Copper chaperone CopZ n=1 Tax=Subtercola frigoramans TaxID=120298 RepID=A0ABS2L4I0_9MICO|nr:cation transporter [Subtercola frigoramans]MBM7471650.1 copper chaperone CopZ [Subtercola frigoramans]